MWAGQTAPFFLPEEKQNPEKQKGPQGAFSSNAGQISVRGL
jgi:hypothetical protein